MYKASNLNYECNARNSKELIYGFNEKLLFYWSEATLWVPCVELAQKEEISMLANSVPRR